MGFFARATLRKVSASRSTGTSRNRNIRPCRPCSCSPRTSACPAWPGNWRSTLPALPRASFRVEVGVLGEDGQAAESLRASGISVHRLPLRSALDVAGIRAVQSAVNRLDPDILHAVGPEAVRAGGLLRGRTRIVSGASSHAGGLLEWATALCLRRADRVLAYSEAEAARYRAQGVAAAHLSRLAPAVQAAPAPPDAEAFRRSLGIPPSARLIFAAGKLDRTAGLKDAVWAFDVLKYESDDFHLVLFGGGPDRDRLESFGRALGFDDYRLRFAGVRGDLPSLFGLAEVVWVTHERGGVNTALEALAAGRPVLGWKNADLADFVADGGSGFLLPRGDRIALASKTRAVLEDKTLAARLGVAARTTALEYGVPRAALDLAAAYRAAALPARPPIPDN